MRFALLSVLVGLVASVPLVLAVSYLVAPVLPVPRVYSGAVLPVLQPGETAISQLPRVTMEDLAGAGGRLEVEPSGWLVEPTPGMGSWWRRCQFRLYGWWLFRYVVPRGPRLEADVSLAHRSDD